MLEGFQNDLAALRQRREMDKLPVLREMLRNGIAELARRCEVAAGKVSSRAPLLFSLQETDGLMEMGGY